MITLVYDMGVIMSSKLKKAYPGEKFGKFTVLEESHFDNAISKSGKIRKEQYVKVQCNCGFIQNSKLNDLRRKQGSTKQCINCRHNSSRRQLEGCRFGNLLVIKNIDNKKCECLCDCGKTKIVHRRDLMFNKTKSCGCKQYLVGKESPHWKGHGEIPKHRWNVIISNAKKRNIEFDVSLEYVWNLFLKQERKCVLSGLEIYFSKSSRDEDFTASLDRIDNSKGYIEGNVQWLHKDINLMKGTHKQEYFVELCRFVAQKELE